MAVANTLAYYITATITAVKRFIVQAPGHSVCQCLHQGLTTPIADNDGQDVRGQHLHRRKVCPGKAGIVRPDEEVHREAELHHERGVEAEAGTVLVTSIL